MSDEFDDIVGSQRVEVFIRERQHLNELIMEMIVPAQRPIEFITLNFTVDANGICHAEADFTPPVLSEEDEFIAIAGTRPSPSLFDRAKALPFCHTECIGSLSCRYER